MATQDTQGVRLIASERDRQIEAEGWTPEHDDEHIGWDLSRAAMSYILSADHASAGKGLMPQPIHWPWAPESYRPSGDAVRDLTKAGALIAAEIDRLLRARFGESGTITVVIEPDPTLPFSIWPNTGSVILQQEEDGTYTVSQVGGSRFVGFATEEAALAGAQVAWPQIEGFEKPPLASATIKVAVRR